MRRAWAPTQRGSAPLEMALGVGLILVPLALLSLSFGPLLQRMVFARIAAAEAAREWVLSDGSALSVVRLVGEIALNHGVETSGVGVGFCDGEVGPVVFPPLSSCGPPVKGNPVKVVIAVAGPVLQTPYGEVGDLTVRASHTEMVGLYRSTR